MYHGRLSGDVTTLAPDDGSALRLREAERTDLLTIHRIERAAFPQPWPYAAFERYLDEPGFLVAESLPGDGDAVSEEAGDPPEAHLSRTERDRADGDRTDLVGYVVADTVPNHGTPLGHVKDIAVATDHRGQGIGTRLLDAAIATVDRQDAASVKLEVRESNDAAISMYRDADFEHRRTITNYYGNGEDALVMVRTIDRAADRSTERGRPE